MKISVIIPIYNGEKYIKQCLDTVLNQTYKNIEVILINDGSTDDSDKILKKYQKQDKRINYIKKENSGVSDTRNLGMDKSTGEYITFFDIDDTIELDAIEKIVKYIKKYKTDVVRMNYRIGDYIGEIDNDLIGKNKNIKLLKQEILAAKIPAFCVLLTIKRKILLQHKLRFNSKLFMMEDTIFFLELIDCINSIYIALDVIYHYIQYPTSNSHSIEKVEKNINNVLEVNKIILSKKYNDDLKQIASVREMIIVIDFLKTVDPVKRQQILDDLKENVNLSKMLDNINFIKLNLVNKQYYLALKHHDYKRIDKALKIMNFNKKIEDKKSILKYKINRIKNKYFKIKGK